MSRSLLIQLGFAGLVLILALGLVVGTTLLSEQAQKSTRALAVQIQETNTEVLRVEAAKAALPVLKNAEEALAGRVVHSDDVVPFLESLERTGQGAKVEVLSVTGGEGGQRMSLSVKITGTFDAIMRTVGKIEHRPEDILLTSLTLDTETSEGAAVGGWSAAAVLSVGADATK